jgi:cyclic pyranopterin phosphate synthase
MGPCYLHGPLEPCHACRAMGNPGVYAFEDIDGTLAYMPLAARRVLDGLGRKLSLEGWLSLDVQDRQRIVVAGAGERVDRSVLPIVEGARPAPEVFPPEADADGAGPSPALIAALGPSRPLDAGRWRAVGPLARYALGKYAGKPAKLFLAYDEIVKPSTGPLTHLTASGEAHMVDVGAKLETARRAVASARVRTTTAVVQAIAAGTVGKGDVLAVARVAGILASKRTPDLVPLCHPVRTTHAAVDLDLDAGAGEIRVRATVEAVDRTGVEMEAMTAASVASLTVYDMVKSADRWASIEGVRLEAKSGGKSGDVVRPPERS